MPAFETGGGCQPKPSLPCRRAETKSNAPLGPSTLTHCDMHVPAESGVVRQSLLTLQKQTKSGQ